MNFLHLASSGGGPFACTFLCAHKQMMAATHSYRMSLEPDDLADMLARHVGLNDNEQQESPTCMRSGADDAFATWSREQQPFPEQDWTGEASDGTWSRHESDEDDEPRRGLLPETWDMGNPESWDMRNIDARLPCRMQVLLKPHRTEALASRIMGHGHPRVVRHGQHRRPRPLPHMQVLLKPHRTEAFEASSTCTQHLVNTIRPFAVVVTLVDSTGRPVRDWVTNLRAHLVYANDSEAVPPTRGDEPLTGETEKRLSEGSCTLRLRAGAVSYHHNRRSFQVCITADELPGGHFGTHACSEPVRFVARLPNESKPPAEHGGPIGTNQMVRHQSTKGTDEGALAAAGSQALPPGPAEPFAGTQSAVPLTSSVTKPSQAVDAASQPSWAMGDVEGAMVGETTPSAPIAPADAAWPTVAWSPPALPTACSSPTCSPAASPRGACTRVRAPTPASCTPVCTAPVRIAAAAEVWPLTSAQRAEGEMGGLREDPIGIAIEGGSHHVSHYASERTATDETTTEEAATDETATDKTAIENTTTDETVIVVGADDGWSSGEEQEELEDVPMWVVPSADRSAAVMVAAANPSPSPNPSCHNMGGSFWGTSTCGGVSVCGAMLEELRLQQAMLHKVLDQQRQIMSELRARHERDH